MDDIPAPANPLPRLGHLSADSHRPRSHSSGGGGSSKDRHGKSHSRHGSTSNSRSGSPAPGSTSGSALIAKRATSPSRSRNGSPGPGSAGKRKRTEEDAEARDKRKRSGRSTPEPSVAGEAPTLTEADLIKLLRTKPSFSTKEVLSAFKKELKLPANKRAIAGLLQAVAKMDGGVLTLKPGL